MHKNYLRRTLAIDDVKVFWTGKLTFQKCIQSTPINHLICVSNRLLYFSTFTKIDGCRQITYKRIYIFKSTVLKYIKKL